MRGYGLLFFILSLPVLAALGHDIYVTYHAQDLDPALLLNKRMMFSDVGYLWTHYSTETYTWAKANISPGVWKDFVGPFLEQMTVLVAALPLIATFLVLATLKLLKLPPFNNGVRVSKGHKKGSFGFGGNDKSKGRLKYKRK